MMSKGLKNICFIFSFLLIVLMPLNARAFTGDPPYGNFENFDGYVKVNEKTGYAAVVDLEVYSGKDGNEYPEGCGPEEIEKILERIYPLTEYTNVAVEMTERISLVRHPADVLESLLFGRNTNDTLIIYFDIEKSQGIIYTYGATIDKISYTDAATISQELTRNLGNMTYYEGVDIACTMILNSFQGKKNISVIGIISAFFIALLISMLVNYLIITRLTVRRKKGAVKIKNSKEDKINITDPGAMFVTTTKVYKKQKKWYGL